MADFDDGCPKCGGEQLCPCANCAPSHPDKVMWKWDEAGEIISCGHCGHTMTADSWLDLDIERFNKATAPTVNSPRSDT